MLVVSKAYMQIDNRPLNRLSNHWYRYGQLERVVGLDHVNRHVAGYVVADLMGEVTVNVVAGQNRATELGRRIEVSGGLLARGTTLAERFNQRLALYLIAVHVDLL